MSNKNDSKVLDLKSKIESLETNLVKPKFNPKTNCNIVLDEIRYNLHTLSKENLILLLVKLNTYTLSAKDLNISISDVKISGFSIEDWMDDIKSKISIVEFNEKEKLLTSKKKELDKLLSEDKRT